MATNKMPREHELERWLVYGVVAFLIAVVTYFAFVAPAVRDELGDGVPTLEPGISDALLRLAATRTATATPAPSTTPRPTRGAGDLSAPTVVAPTSLPGASSITIAPSEREVASFDSLDKLPAYGERSLLVGRLQAQNDSGSGDRHTDYLGGIAISLRRVPMAARLSYASLELTGLSDLGIQDQGEWTVELLDEEAAQGWADQTFDSLLAARSTGIEWLIRTSDLGTLRSNILEFSEQGREVLQSRLAAGDERVAFRISGEGGIGGQDNLFVWDTGYGPGFGSRPVLRLQYFAPTATPGPAPGEPTTVPLVVWEAEPSPAPSPTPLPEAVPRELRGNILFLSDRFGGPELMVLDVESGRVGRVTQSWPYGLSVQRERSVGDLQVGTKEVPCGSGDATILVDGDPQQNPDPARRCNQVTIRREGGAEEELTPNGFIHYDPVLSPDGTWVAYVSQASGNDEIWAHRVDRTAYRRLTDNEWEWDKHPTWSPDGTHIAFWSNRDGRKQLFRLEFATGVVERLLASPYNDWDPVWVR